MFNSRLQLTRRYYFCYRFLKCLILYSRSPGEMICVVSFKMFNQQEILFLKCLILDSSSPVEMWCCLQPILCYRCCPLSQSETFMVELSQKFSFPYIQFCSSDKKIPCSEKRYCKITKCLSIDWNIICQKPTLCNLLRLLVLCLLTQIRKLNVWLGRGPIV